MWKTNLECSKACSHSEGDLIRKKVVLRSREHFKELDLPKVIVLLTRKEIKLTSGDNVVILTQGSRSTSVVNSSLWWKLAFSFCLNRVMDTPAVFAK